MQCRFLFSVCTWHSYGAPIRQNSRQNTHKHKRIKLRRYKKKEKGREGRQEREEKREMERETPRTDGVQVQVPGSTMMHKLFPIQKTQLEPQNVRITQPIRITCNLITHKKCPHLHSKNCLLGNIRQYCSP